MRFVRFKRNVVRDKVKKCLVDLKCTSIVIDAVDQVIKCSGVASPFDGLHTAYLQQQYFQKHLHFVVSCTQSTKKVFISDNILLGTCGTTTWPSQSSCDSRK